jgi:hypothetical protein
LIARVSARPDVMGEYKSGWLSKAGVWLTFGVMLAAAGAMLYSFL